MRESSLDGRVPSAIHFQWGMRDTTYCESDDEEDNPMADLALQNGSFFYYHDALMYNIRTTV
jgi:hypothetical protein